ncbi:MAG: pyridoxamine 5'-phosphate oxidase family protein [Candidatus Bathyarchaeia archaeon]
MRSSNSAAESLLKHAYFAYLCTLSVDLYPHVVPVFFVFDDATHCIYILTSPSTKKILNMKDNPRVSLSIDSRDPVNPFNNEGLIIQGSVELGYFEESSDETIQPSLASLFQAFEEKYPAFKFRGEVGLEESSEILVKVMPLKVVYWRGPTFQTIHI